jgi:hypothetical protein
MGVYDAAMRPHRSQFNPKRGIKRVTPAERLKLSELAGHVHYSGNPEHKRNPGDYNLTPPASPRRGKTLCDDIQIFRRSDALALLRAGLSRGLVDSRWSGEGWPQLIWAVTEGEQPVEAQRDANGSYHGYPLSANDPLFEHIIAVWHTP